MNSCSLITLTDLNSAESLGIFSFHRDKTDSLFYLFLLLHLWTLLVPSPLTSVLPFRTQPKSFVRFSCHSIRCNIVLAFQVPHSSEAAYQPACRTAGRISGLWLSAHISWTHTYTLEHRGRSNKFTEPGLLFHYLCRKVYCFLLQAVQ